MHRNGASNIHIAYERPEAMSGNVILAYGDCDMKHHDAAHHTVGQFDVAAYGEEKPFVSPAFLIRGPKDVKDMLNR